MQTNQNMCQEDEIDLRELFLTLKRNKKTIFLVTLLITFLAAIYVFIKTPVYEAKAMLEIGNYKSFNTNKDGYTINEIQLDDVNQLSKKLNVLYVDMHKNDVNVKSKITAISVPKKSKVFLEIKADGVSNKLATEKILDVVHYIQKSHQQILDDVKKRREFEIKNIDRKIANIQNTETKLLDEKIELQEKNLKEYSLEIEELDKNFQKIKKSNPTLAALSLMKRRDLSDFILKLNLQLLELKDKKDNLITNDVWKLKEKRNLLSSLLLPYNYKNSNIVGKVLTDNKPAKPKKILILLVAFVTGLILSVFLVFFLEFLKSMKNEKNEEESESIEKL